MHSIKGMSTHQIKVVYNDNLRLVLLYAETLKKPVY